jgi:hypothetical protein
MADVKARGKSGGYGITYSSGFKNLGAGWTGAVSGGRNQPTTVGAYKTRNSVTFSVAATPSQNGYGISFSKGFK